MELIIFAIVAIPLTAIIIYSIINVVPVTNRLFALIWQDPSERQRAAVARRLKELHVDGSVPNETAVLLTAKEFNTSEDELFKVMDMVSATDLMGMLTGKQNAMGVITNGIRKTLKRGTGRKR